MSPFSEAAWFVGRVLCEVWSVVLIRVEYLLIALPVYQYKARVPTARYCKLLR